MVKGAIKPMLKQFTSDSDYLLFLDSNFSSLSSDNLQLLSNKSFKSALFKMKKLRLDDIRNIISPLYSSTGRPALHQAELFRSFILMSHFKFTSIDSWVHYLQSNSLLQYLIGSFFVPSVSSHYDFISRFSMDKQSFSSLHPKSLFVRKEKTKPANGQKLENFTRQDTESLYNLYINGASWNRDRTMYSLQLIFNALAVIPSIENNLIDTSNLILSGDGSSLHIHASPYGHRVLDDNEAIDNITHRYSAPNASYGWDSDLNVFYFGYTFYNISYHNPIHKIDLPLFISIENASRHDALSSISATAQFLDINPSLKPKHMCFDSASDAYFIFKYLSDSGINPIIDRNKRKSGKTKYKQFSLNEDGIPICPNGTPMVSDGYEVKRNRRKFRCPLATGQIKSCPFKDQCSTSPYGRTVQIKQQDNPQIHGSIPYRSNEWKEIYKNRTSTERINNRILNDYKLQHLHCRSKGKFEFLSIIAGINLHFDAQFKLA